MPTSREKDVRPSVTGLLIGLVVLCAVRPGAAEEAREAPATATESEAEQPPPPTDEELRTYTIQPSDTLFDIATRNGITLEQLLALNGDIADPDRIFTGHHLRLPATPPPPSEPVET